MSHELGTWGRSVLRNVKALIHPSEAYFGLMQQYSDFFRTIFGSELVAFGYEKFYNKGFYQAISSLPQIAQIFAETKAYQTLQAINHRLCVTEYGFIHTDGLPNQAIYNQFRSQLNKELDIYSTFYALEPCLNYKHVFVWNFRAPLKSISLEDWKNEILLSFMKNNKQIQYVTSHFVSLYRQKISKDVVSLKLLQPSNQEESQELTPIDNQLIDSKWLDKNDLYLRNIYLSEKETMCIHYYLQGMSAKEIGTKIFVSRRTVEDHIARIKLKLKAETRSAIYAAMEKVNLWRNTL